MGPCFLPRSLRDRVDGLGRSNRSARLLSLAVSESHLRSGVVSSQGDDLLTEMQRHIAF